MSDARTNRYASDPRVDRMVTWGLTAFAGLALSVGAWFFSGLTDTVKDLSQAVGELKTEVAVLRTERQAIEQLREEMREMKARVRALETAR